MYPYIHLGPLTIGTFGLLLWLAAVCAGYVLHLNFRRFHVEADAISVVAFVTVLGVIGAKLWHVLEDPEMLIHFPVATLFDRAGFAWYGGLIAGILTLMWQGRAAKTGALGMLDLAAPAAAAGYGVGRLGCLTSGDGDYGIPTSLPWGMSFPHGLVPTVQRVHPTPIYELVAALIIAAILWKRGRRNPGEITGEYLVLSGLARFLVEFIRINPRIYFGMSNAQVASIGSMVIGIVLIVWVRRHAAARAGQPAPAT
ncbi:MAG TPA: prolipoprotein diacylglyceryl transferase family protein [Acidobacteriaceae bacterium]